MKSLDLTGVRFDRVVAVEPCQAHQRKRGWRLVCDCGRSLVASTGDLQRGKVKSCGCGKARHGLIHGGANTREYRIWQNMRTRCNNPNFKQRKDYADRGIRIDPRWDDFAVFIADMGPCPPGLTIERNDNDEGYYPWNCRWATRAEQNRNKRKR